MGKRGAKPKGKIKILWSREFAYAIGLIASDGCLSPSGRHIIFVSHDKDQVENFMKALKLKNRIGKNSTGNWRVQFGDVLFYRFLLSIGIMPNKSKVLDRINVPPEYFRDFLRGSFDGDGSSHSYWDRRWKSSYMFYTIFASASAAHIRWLRSEIERRVGAKGHLTKTKDVSTVQLKYAKKDSLKLIRFIYYSPRILCLERKRLKIRKMLAIVGEHI